MSIELSGQQLQAVDAVIKWSKTASKTFILTGHAGSGKTTIAKTIASNFKSVLYGAFTGKAASVLESKGCIPATTIHSMIYRAKLDESSGVWSFKLDTESPAAQVELVIVDEISMISTDIGIDLMRVAKRVLVLGDSAQLPPINGEPFFDLSKPDFHLTEIHRQAKDNPIIALATMAREGVPIQLGTYGSSKVLRNKQFTEQMMLDSDQVLVGRNNTRHGLNARYRKATGAPDFRPIIGDKLICLKNSRERGYLNGGLWKVDSVVYDSDAVELAVSQDGAEFGIKIFTFNEYFDGTDASLSWKQKMQNDEFCYGYAVTTHKFQGSQAGNVLIVDESAVFKEHAKKWLYTAITRASESLTLLI